MLLQFPGIAVRRNHARLADVFVIQILRLAIVHPRGDGPALRGQEVPVVKLQHALLEVLRGFDGRDAGLLVAVELKDVGEFFHAIEHGILEVFRVRHGHQNLSPGGADLLRELDVLLQEVGPHCGRLHREPLRGHVLHFPAELLHPSQASFFQRRRQGVRRLDQNAEGVAVPHALLDERADDVPELFLGAELVERRVVRHGADDLLYGESFVPELVAGRGLHEELHGVVLLALAVGHALDDHRHLAHVRRRAEDFLRLFLVRHFQRSETRDLVVDQRALLQKVVRDNVGNFLRALLINIADAEGVGLGAAEETLFSHLRALLHRERLLLSAGSFHFAHVVVDVPHGCLQEHSQIVTPRLIRALKNVVLRLP
mmetsp:Transcript_41838/g.89135  ORF Transcript_41838/g.89135 Transcript_41838/m.89135 type:complete len:371 (-) Transcript_41838:187-1299(-)